jgi:TfoX/Sxy family transcriptional regulator of competence genes
MAYDEGLAQRISELLDDNAEYEYNEKKMFGGICYLLNGNMACGILKEDLIVRVGPKKYKDYLKKPHTRKFDITGKPMKGWIMVTYKGLESDKELLKWVRLGVNFALSLPRK